MPTTKKSSKVKKPTSQLENIKAQLEKARRRAAVQNNLSTMPNGKHAGKTFEQIYATDEQYLYWVTEKYHSNPELVSAVSNFLDRKISESEESLTLTDSSKWLPELVEWQNAVKTVYASYVENQVNVLSIDAYQVIAHQARMDTLRKVRQVLESLPADASEEQQAAAAEKLRPLKTFNVPKVKRKNDDGEDWWKSVAA